MCGIVFVSLLQGCKEQLLHEKVALASWIEDLVLQQGAAAKQVNCVYM